MSGLSREVLKWVQSLDLTWKMKVPKWDLTNGYLVAEIFSCYYSQKFTMDSFVNCTSLKCKLNNWFVIKEFIRSKHLDIPEEYVEGTIHCKEGAANLLLEHMFTILTNRRVLKRSPPMEPNYTDYAYQVQLPMHARSTASKAVKNNLRLTEVLYDQNDVAAAQKCQKIINNHIDHRRIERQQDPHRFGIRPTLAELCVRKLPSVMASSSQHLQDQTVSSNSISVLNMPSEDDVSLPASPEGDIHFKEMQEKEMDKTTFCGRPILGC